MLFFFYGTLMDRELRQTLAGAHASRLRVTPGVLLNYRRMRARDGDYPVLVPRLGARTPGLFVEGMDRHLLLWVAHFEGPGYLPGRVTAKDLEGRRFRPWTFLPSRRSLAGDVAWDFVGWRRTHKPRLRAQMNNWLLTRSGGYPLALDVPWAVRRKLPEIAADRDGRRLPGPAGEDGDEPRSDQYAGEMVAAE